MIKKYYVIVDLSNLCYMNNGECEKNITIADKFNTYEECLDELRTYDDMENFAIYEVEEDITRTLKKAEKEEKDE